MSKEEEKREGIAGDGNSKLSPHKFMTFDLVKKLFMGFKDHTTICEGESLEIKANRIIINTILTDFVTIPREVFPH